MLLLAEVGARSTNHTTQFSRHASTKYYRSETDSGRRLPLSSQSGRNDYLITRSGFVVRSSRDILPPLPQFGRKMLVTLTFITTPTSDTRGTCLVLSANDQKFLVGNLHEGLQRAMIERSIKSMGVTQAFLTGQTEWAKAGGLLGWILSTADALKMAGETLRQRVNDAKRMMQELPADKVPLGVKKLAETGETTQRLSFHGGANLAYLIATARRFIFRKGRPVTVHEYSSEERVPAQELEPSWQNDLIRVWAMPILASAVPQPAQTSPSPDVATQKQPAEFAALLQPIVKNMFDSDWRMDDLAQMSLRDVKLPAAVFIRNPETRQLEQYREYVPQNPTERPDIQVLVRKPWPGALVPNLPPTSPKNISMCYVIGLHAPRGKFLPQKAKELKVRPGPNFNLLASGQSVVAEDGTTVLPEQVLGPARPGRSVLFAELPQTEYIEAFLARTELSNTTILSEIVVAVWILGHGVAEDPRLQSFIQQHPEWKHVITSPDYGADYLVFDGAAEGLIQHHLADPQRFNVPKFDDEPRKLPNALAHCELATRGQRIKIEPDVTYEPDSSEPYLNTGEVVEQFPKEVEKLADVARKRVEARTEQKSPKPPLPGAENEIVTLGTGSALPSKHRNVSATLLRVPGVGSYLLDCGENTLGQLTRLYGQEGVLEILRDLKMIWISHMHADHHLGTTSVIKAWYQAVHGGPAKGIGHAKLEASLPGGGILSQLKQPKKLFFIAEPAMSQWLREYSSVEDYGYHHLVLIDSFPVSKNGTARSSLRCKGEEVGYGSANSEICNAMRQATGLADLVTCSVPHCHGARGVAFTFPDGFKLTYSGDARPSQNLVDIGQNSTVLLHEATFDDELQGDAKAKGHSTTSEALGVGLAMKAKRVILTHFSQRYSKIPVMSDISSRNIVLEETDASNQDAPEGIDDPESMATLAVQDPSLEGEETPSAFPPAKSTAPTTTRARPTNIIKTSAQQMEDMKVAVAFDYMRVKVKDIEVLEKFTPAFVELYKTANDHLNVSEADRAEKQIRAKERKAAMKENNRRKRSDNPHSPSPRKRSKSSTNSERHDVDKDVA